MNSIARSQRVAASLLTGAAILCGCRGDASVEHGGATVRDSSGVRIVMNPAVASSDAAPVWSIDTTASLIIGGAEPTGLSQQSSSGSGASSPVGAAAYTNAGSNVHFSGVMELTRLQSGHLVALDWGKRALLVFDSAGTQLASYGGEGSAPGTFRNLQGLTAARGDTFSVVDMTAGRVTWLTARDGIIRTYSQTMSLLVSGRGEGYRVRQGRALSDSLYALEVFRNRGAGSTLTGVPRIFSYQFAGHGARGNTFLGPYDEGDPLYSRYGTQPLMSRHPFAARVMHVVQPAAQMICAGKNDMRTIDCMRIDGRRLSIRWESDSIPVSDSLRTDWMNARRAEFASTHPKLAGAGDSVIAAAVWPANLPPYESFTIDDDGNIWVLERDPAGGERYRVFDENGVFISLVKGMQLRPVHIGSAAMTGVWTDARGVESVRVYSIVKRVRPPG